MRPLAALAAVALAAVALAGCAEDRERYPDGVPSSSSSSTSRSATGSATGSGSATATGTGTPSGNRPPTAGLALGAVNGTNVTFVVTGADPDGDALSWTLDFGDGNATEGTELPANVTHSYAPGNHTATLTVDDGAETGEATLDVALGGAGPTGPPDTYTFTGTAVGAHEPALTGLGVGTTLVHSFAVFGPVTGLRAHLTWSPAAPGIDLDLYVNDATGEERGSSACFHASPAPFPFGCNRGPDEEVLVALTPGDAGEWTAEVVPFEAPNVAYTLTIEFTV